MRTPSTTAYVTRGGIEIKGRYAGGAYIDVYIGGSPEPIEVINVFDYEAGRSTIEHKTQQVRHELIEWAKDYSHNELLEMMKG